MSTASTMKGLLRGNVRQYGMVIALVTIVVLFQIWNDGVLLKPLNVTNLLTQNAAILILAIGMVMVIIARHIDLSVGSVAAFVGAVAAIVWLLLRRTRSPSRRHALAMLGLVAIAGLAVVTLRACLGSPQVRLCGWCHWLAFGVPLSALLAARPDS